MKTTDSRPSALLGVKVDPALADEIRRAARAEDRTVSGYLRRMITAAVRPSAVVEEKKEREP
jgi:hypothetical protein